MDRKLNRRDLLGAMCAFTPLTQSVLAAQTTEGPAQPDKTTPYRKVVLAPFDYHGVTLGQSRWQKTGRGRPRFLLRRFER
jgi:hypothetical protein